MIIGLSLGIGSTSQPAAAASVPRTGVSVPGCLVYLENAVNMNNSGGLLTTWANQGSLGGNMTFTATNAPAYEAAAFNGRPSYAMVKASTEEPIFDALAGAIDGDAQPFTIVAAVQWTAAPVAGDCMFGLGSSSSATPFFQLRAASGPIWNVIRRNDAASLAQQSAGAIDTNRHVVTLIYTGANTTVRVDGVAVINNLALNGGAVTLDRFGLAHQRAAAGSAHSSARVAEFSAYDSVLSGATLTDVENDIARLLA